MCLEQTIYDYVYDFERQKGLTSTASQIGSKKKKKNKNKNLTLRILLRLWQMLFAGDNQRDLIYNTPSSVTSDLMPAAVSIMFVLE